MRLIICLIVALVFIFGCKKKEETSLTNTTPVIYKKIAKITCTSTENDIYKGDSLLIEYNGEKISKISFGANRYYLTYNYINNFIVVTYFDYQGNINDIDTLDLNTNGQVIHSRLDNIYYSYNSEGYLISDNDCDIQIVNGNNIKEIIKQNYPDSIKRGCYYDIEYYNTLNANNLYQSTYYDVYKFNGAFGKPNKNLIKSKTFKFPNGNIIWQNNYSYEIDSLNIITKIHVSAGVDTIDYNLFYY